MLYVIIINLCLNVILGIWYLLSININNDMFYLRTKFFSDSPALPKWPVIAFYLSLRKLTILIFSWGAGGKKC